MGIANGYLYTGRFLDGESDLYYYRHRYLDSALGAFVSRDPIGYVDGLNLYRAYFAVNGVDPSGQLELEAVNGGPQISGDCSGAFLGIWVTLEEHEKQRIRESGGGVLLVEKRTTAAAFDCCDDEELGSTEVIQFTCYPVWTFEDIDGVIFTESHAAEGEQRPTRQYSVALNVTETSGEDTYGEASAYFHVDLLAVKPGHTPQSVCERFFERRTKGGSVTKGWHRDDVPPNEFWDDFTTFFNAHETVNAKYNYNYCNGCQERMTHTPQLPPGPNRAGR